VQNGIEPVRKAGKAGDSRAKLQSRQECYLDKCYPHPVQREETEIVHTPRRKSST